jgi:hypothetical protein
MKGTYVRRPEIEETLTSQLKTALPVVPPSVMSGRNEK